jgi:hypothetical protein
MPNVWNTMKRILLCGWRRDNRMGAENEFEMPERQQAANVQEQPGSSSNTIEDGSSITPEDIGLQPAAAANGYINPLAL